MKTLEMVKELMENPGKEFKAECGNIVINRNGSIYWSGSKILFNLNYTNLAKRWEEIKKPVDFMTALKSDKKIKVEHTMLKDFSVFNKYCNFTDLLENLLNYFTSISVREIILNGEWHIEKEV